MLLGRETSVGWCARIPVPTPLQQSQEGSGAAGWLAMGAGNSHGSFSPALSLPGLAPSQSRHKGLSCNLPSCWMRQGAPVRTRGDSALLAASSQKSPQTFRSSFFFPLLFWIFNNALAKPGPNYSPLPSPARSKSPAPLQSITGRQLSSQLGPRASPAVPSPAAGSLSHTHARSCSLVRRRMARFCQPTGWRNQDQV